MKSLKQITIRMGMLITAVLLLGLVVQGCSQDQKSDPTIEKRHVELQQQPNFRDMGGYKTADGRTVKWGLLYRSGELSKITDIDLAKLEKLGIRTVVDFRTESEVQSRGKDRLPEGAQGVALPMDPGDLSAILQPALETGDLSKIPSDLMEQLNRSLVHDFTKDYAVFMQLVADPEKRPIVWHCTHGKDRAGMGSAIVLSVLGVPWETVRKDYVLSNFYRKDENEAQLAQIREEVAEKQGISPDKVDLSKIEPLFNLRPEFLDAGHEEIVKEYGTMENFIREGLGISNEQLEHLRDELLE